MRGERPAAAKEVAIASPRLIAVTPDMCVYGTSPTDVRFLYREIFEWGTYRDVRLPHSPLVVDAGANVGIFTLFIKRLCARAEVLAFEPVASLAAAMRRNLGHFGLDHVTVHEVALGARPAGSVPFRHYPLRPSGSSMFLDDQTRLKAISAGWLSPALNERFYQGEEISVSVAPLSTYLPEGRQIDLLKLDVVGAELDVLAGITDHQWPQIRQVVADVQDLNGRVAEVCEALHTRGMTTVLRQNDTAAGDGLNFVVLGSRSAAYMQLA